MTEPLRIVFDVDCDIEHAFTTWTERFSIWWPRGHSVSGDPTDVILEPRPGGRIFERTRGGDEIDWGWITAWEPPHRLAYRWHIHRTAAEATDVEVRLVALDERTRVEITHTGWDRLGEEADAWRDANRGGWNGLLPHFVAACTETHSTKGQR
jgi:uncharacterized protein YndB with AHSA1/START domain